MNNISMEEIVRLAALQVKIDSSDSDQHSSDMEVFTKGLALLNVGDSMMLMVAAKLLVGKPYCITNDNPETFERCRSLAEYMGASIQQMRADGIITRMILIPPGPL